MSIINVQRDGIYIDPLTSLESNWCSAKFINAAPGRMSGSASTNIDVGKARSSISQDVTCNVGSYLAIGTYIMAPNGDRTPYRVKGGLIAPETPDGDYRAMLIIGFAEASPTGTDDDILEPVYIPVEKTFDELVIVEAEEEGDTYFGRPLAVALAVVPNQNINTETVHGTLSVQNLGIKPPTMQNAVS